MLKKEISLIPIQGLAITQILQICEDCKISCWTAKDYTDELKRNDSFSISCVINHQKNTIGFIFARLITPRHSFNLTYKKNLKQNLEFDEAEILSFAVSPQYQDKGIGQIIFDFFVNSCTSRRIHTIWLEVRKSNTQAQGFYSKNGFQISYSRKNYYQNPVEDAFVMKVNLTFT